MTKPHRRNWVLVIIIVAAVIFVAGLMGMLMVGALPSPDASFAVSERKSSALDWTCGAMVFGLALGLTSVVLVLIRLTLKRLTKG